MTFDNAHHVQAEHDVYQLSTIISDLALDWNTPTGRETILKNEIRIEAAADELAAILDRIRSAASKRDAKITMAQFDKLIVDLRSVR